MRRRLARAYAAADSPVLGTVGKPWTGASNPRRVFASIPAGSGHTAAETRPAPPCTFDATVLAPPRGEIEKLFREWKPVPSRVDWYLGSTNRPRNKPRASQKPKYG